MPCLVPSGLVRVPVGAGSPHTPAEPVAVNAKPGGHCSCDCPEFIALTHVVEEQRAQISDLAGRLTRLEELLLGCQQADLLHGFFAASPQVPKLPGTDPTQVGQWARTPAYPQPPLDQIQANPNQQLLLESRLIMPGEGRTPRRSASLPSGGVRPRSSILRTPDKNAPSQEFVAYDYVDGNHSYPLRFEISNGRLVCISQVGAQIVKKDITQFTWRPLDNGGGTAVDQTGVAWPVPARYVTMLQVLADRSGVPHNLPKTATLSSSSGPMPRGRPVPPVLVNQMLGEPLMKQASPRMISGESTATLATRSPQGDHLSPRHQEECPSPTVPKVFTAEEPVAGHTPVRQFSSNSRHLSPGRQQLSPRGPQQLASQLASRGPSPGPRQGGPTAGAALQLGGLQQVVPQTVPQAGEVSPRRLTQEVLDAHSKHLAHSKVPGEKEAVEVGTSTLSAMSDTQVGGQDQTGPRGSTAVSMIVRPGGVVGPEQSSVAGEPLAFQASAASGLQGHQSPVTLYAPPSQENAATAGRGDQSMASGDHTGAHSVRAPSAPISITSKPQNLRMQYVDLGSATPTGMGSHGGSQTARSSYSSLQQPGSYQPAHQTHGFHGLQQQYSPSSVPSLQQQLASMQGLQQQTTGMHSAATTGQGVPQRTAMQAEFPAQCGEMEQYVQVDAEGRPLPQQRPLLLPRKGDTVAEGDGLSPVRRTSLAGGMPDGRSAAYDGGMNEQRVQQLPLDTLRPEPSAVLLSPAQPWPMGLPIDSLRPEPCATLPSPSHHREIGGTGSASAGGQRSPMAVVVSADQITGQACISADEIAALAAGEACITAEHLAQLAARGRANSITDDIFDAFDLDNDGVLNRTEFLAAVRTKQLIQGEVEGTSGQP